MKYAEEEEDGNLYTIFRNGNPEEIYPMWIEKTDDMRAFGWGDFTFYQYAPYLEIPYSVENLVTYIGNQSLTVPAGTFDCVVATFKSKMDFPLDISGTVTQTLYLDPPNACWE